MGELEVNQFLSHVAVKENVAASTQNQALSAILFLYREVLQRQIGDLGRVTWAKKPKRLPVAFSREEVKAVLSQLSGTHWLMASLLYGAGLRLLECLKLRVKDIDFDCNQIIVRDGKGNLRPASLQNYGSGAGKDRVTVLPNSLKEPLRHHLAKVKKLHEADLKQGYGVVDLPGALARKYPNAGREFAWQYVFPSAVISVNRVTGLKQRHHAVEKPLQKAVKLALRKAGINKHASPAPFP